MAPTSSVTSPSSDSAASAAVPDAVRARLEELFARAVADDRTAGITWAVVGGHDAPADVLAAGAAGDAELDGGVPADGSLRMGTGTISRIASMTKSFTAASILRLRDEGRLALDDAVSRHLPEAASLDTAAPDQPVITLRLLLTMSAGLVTDNPWGDRQEAMTREAFAEVLRGGLGLTSTPGTGFEYSNTGFALLGRVIDEVAGTPYTRYIEERFLRPLGMADTAFDVEDLDRDRVAIGHRIADRADRTRFEPLPFDRPGVYGAMAGLYSTTADVARWVRFLAAADAPDPAARDQEPLSTASRREMQQMHRHQRLAPLPAGPDGRSPGFDRVRGYGYGLVVEDWPDLGEIVSHSGGYPGYGSFMCWHRDSGVGVVALANAKYGPASSLAMEAMRVLLSDTRLLAPRRAVAAPRALEAARAALQWLASGEDAVADAWFADNMDLDTPRDERLRRRDAALAEAGLDLAALSALSVDDARVLSPAHLSWQLPARGEDRPGVRVDVLVDPRREALVQAIDVATALGSRNY
ncbi:serine hydrolase domain-containing protein [Brachybacterium huguangmaarense]